MSFSGNLYSIASTGSERLLFSLGMGTLLAMMVWLLLRVSPKKDSRTSFAVWFATLLITAVLPLASLWMGSPSERAGSGAAVVTISASWAVYIFLGWASVACIGLLRVLVALWQVHRLRAGTIAVDEQALHPELKTLVEEFRRWREVELLVSRRLQVPTAIGFLKPAIVLPEWLLEETPAEELKYIVLHELEHLRRRDDWTNLAQQIVKALLFFVPSVWWIERRLALDREMACDDAVLAQSGTPHGYAECLTRVAERSFLRRQLALAQAAVSRVRQLSVRVTRILDPKREQSAQIWKPAIPAVMIVAGLCAFTVSQSPTFIGFAGKTTVVAQSSAVSPGVAVGSLAPAQVGVKPVRQTGMDRPVKMIPANLKDNPRGADSAGIRAWDASFKLNHKVPQKAHGRKRVVRELGNLRAANKIPRGAMVLAGLQPPLSISEGGTLREDFVMVVSQRDFTTAAGWQVRVVEISVTQSKPQRQIPKKI